MKAPFDSARRMEVRRRRENVARLDAEGVTPARIADKLGLSDGIVRRDLTRIKKSCRRFLDRDPATAKSYELAKINRLEAVAWEGWERSFRDDETTKVTLDGEKKKIEKVTHNQPGDPRFLDRIEWCINKRCEILSLMEPSTVTGVGPFALNVPHEQMQRRTQALIAQWSERGSGPGAGTLPVDPPVAGAS